ncbi:flagellum-specific ATP synthase [Aequitasia blattaphilus]|uniref:Flagellar protein export ATPase FliI n=1 Tax=Aequitasia blattaphilus TaxID=2949332 RepID=A0ABT1E9Z8_9FIRM|nr:flagellar protein export ATPase FliI [Aequitasia blattaphilus]MCP1102506.1 flagellar protein export ATPase FliI [Aequitasia blattaphilus]MCR8615146.1 flagellar protein export ATPase FliI [Aequitasia blattaphilus]
MLQHIPEMIKNSRTMNYIGRVENIIGMTIEASGGSANIGDIVMIQNDEQKKEIPAEVVGVRDDRLQLMVYESMQGIGSGCYVTNTKKRLKIPVGEFLRGRVIDALGNPIDGKGAFVSEQYYYVENTMTNPLSRPPIQEELGFGVKAIDGLNTIGKGQRIGIFAGSGVGKSTLLGMIARNVETDINVIALVGERGREVREFIEKDLGPEGMKRSILVIATSDQPAMMRMKCPMVATTIAEYFRDQGKNVLLMMDSLTRFAMAHREIGLATGEPPIARGYTPSIYAEFPKLLERSGNFEKGSITGVYTVLVEGDDTNEPVADTVRGILDGHIVLTRKLANRGHFPAIDISSSISRLMSSIIGPEHKEAAAKLRDIISLYEQNEDLISIGAYKAGSNPKLDDAIEKINAVTSLVKQQIEERFSSKETVEMMKKIVG